MQVSVEKLEGLERRLTIEMPADQIDSEVNKRLSKLTSTVKIDGFRKGKVPIKEVERRYGQSVRQEVIGDMMQRCFFDAVNEKELRPAGMPHIEPKISEQGKAVEFTATFEVYPEINLPDFKKIKVEKITSEVKDEDIDETLNAIRKQYTEWQTVERASQSGDRVTIDFAGTIDGEPLEKGEAKDFPLELGSNSMIPGFEDGIMGAKAGDELTIKPTFPEDYHAKELAGKTVEFAITVHKVEEPKLPEINDTFAKKLGVKAGTVADLRNEIRNNMERELTNNLKQQTKQKVMDAVFDVAKVELPKALIDSEIQQMQQNLMQQLGGKGDMSAFLEKSTDMFEEQATRRVTLGLVVGELIKQAEMKPDAEKVKAHIENIAASYEKPEDVTRWYYQDAKNLREVEALIIEDQVVDKILAEATVTEKAVPFAEVMKQGHQH